MEFESGTYREFRDDGTEVYTVIDNVTDIHHCVVVTPELRKWLDEAGASVWHDYVNLKIAEMLRRNR